MAAAKRIPAYLLDSFPRDPLLGETLRDSFMLSGRLCLGDTVWVFKPVPRDDFARYALLAERATAQMTRHNMGYRSQGWGRGDGGNSIAGYLALSAASRAAAAYGEAEFVALVNKAFSDSRLDIQLAPPIKT